jgi:hypothetical protein
MALLSVFRTDGWVKTVQGPAVPGAQIYVCLQPANQTVPPTPLANIYSDPNGLVPITQPINTDGFGHYDFYAQAGVYTVIVVNGGIIQQVYPDQSVGGANGTGSALVLENNGIVNGNQFLLNLHSADGSVVITDDGIGDINLKAAVSAYSTSGQGWFLGPGIPNLAPTIQGFNAAITNFSANAVIVQQFVLEASWTLSKCAYELSSTTASSSFNFGIYSASGNKLIDAAFVGTTTNVQVVTFSPTTLPAGVYYFAASATANSFTGPAIQAGVNVYGQVLKMLNAGVGAIVAAAANAASGGALPSTLGTLTPINTTAQWQSVPIPVWMV